MKTLKSFQKKIKKEIFEQCHSAEKCKRGTFWDFLTSILLQIIETIEGRLFGVIEKFSEKISYYRKKSKLKTQR